MRTLILAVILAIGQTTYADNSRALEDVIIEAVECVRRELTAGLPEFDIPSFDPLTIVDFTLDFDALNLPNIAGVLNIQNTLGTGLMDFILSDVKGTIGLIPPTYTIDLTLTFPNPTIDTDYSGDVTVGQLSTFGAGQLSLIANNVVAVVHAKAGILGGIEIQEFSLLPSMDPLTAFKITGSRNDEEFSAELSENILNNGHQLLDQYAQEMSDLLSGALQAMMGAGGDGAPGFLTYLIDTCVGL